MMQTFKGIWIDRTAITVSIDDYDLTADERQIYNTLRDSGTSMTAMQLADASGDSMLCCMRLMEELSAMGYVTATDITVGYKDYATPVIKRFYKDTP